MKPWTNVWRATNKIKETNFNDNFNHYGDTTFKADLKKY